MKTIREIVVERHLDRSTLLKAAQQGRIPARQSGATWLIDDESPEFAAWLTARVKRCSPPETNPVETPDVPTWITTEAGKHMWKNSHEWRVNAFRADDKMYRRHLLKVAERHFNNE